MRIKQRYLFLVFTIVLSIIISACSDSSNNEEVSGEEGSSSDKLTIGFSVGTTQEERWQTEIELAQAYADENNIDLIIQSAEEDASNQLKQVEDMITNGIDVLLISAQDSEAAGSVIDIAHEADVPVVAYDRLVRNGDLDYYVTFDTVKVGELQAQALVDKYPKGNYIWLLGGPEDFNAHLIKEGHEKVLNPLIEKGDINIVTEQWADGWSAEVALSHTENGLTAANNDVVAVLASNDATAGGAVQALEAQGLAGEVGVSGQDAALEGVQRIVEGKQTSTVYKPLKELNNLAMQLVHALAEGDVDKANELVNGETDNGVKDVSSILVDVINVDKDNMLDTVIADDFQKIEDVYKNVPKEEWPE